MYRRLSSFRPPPHATRSFFSWLRRKPEADASRTASAAPPAARTASAPACTAAAMQHVVIGGGAIGSLLAAKLALASNVKTLAGSNVWLLTRQSVYRNAIQTAGGLTLVTPPAAVAAAHNSSAPASAPATAGSASSAVPALASSLLSGWTRTHVPVHVTDSATDIFTALRPPPAAATATATGPLAVWICGKGLDDTEYAARVAKRLLGTAGAPQTGGGAGAGAGAGVAVSLQNGIGHYDIIARFVGHERTVVGTTSHGATIDAPGVVVHRGFGDTTLVDALAPSSQSPLSPGHVIASVLESAGFRVSGGVLHPSKRDAVLWAKLVVNAAINPLTAYLRVRNGFLSVRNVSFDPSIDLLYDERVSGQQSTHPIKAPVLKGATLHTPDKPKQTLATAAPNDPLRQAQIVIRHLMTAAVYEVLTVAHALEIHLPPPAPPAAAAAATAAVATASASSTDPQRFLLTESGDAANVLSRALTVYEKYVAAVRRATISAVYPVTNPLYPIEGAGGGAVDRRTGRPFGAPAVSPSSAESVNAHLMYALSVVERTAPNISSMCSDVITNRARTEADVILDTVTRAGMKCGVATPLISTLAILIRRITTPASNEVKHVPANIMQRAMAEQQQTGTGSGSGITLTPLGESDPKRSIPVVMPNVGLGMPPPGLPPRRAAGTGGSCASRPPATDAHTHIDEAREMGGAAADGGPVFHSPDASQLILPPTNVRRKQPQK